MATWVFRQLSGDKKILTLDGYSAPFGRPRREAVVRDGENVRVKSTRYPGNSGPPTRHIFGMHYHDLDLKGRWRDRALGIGGAKKKLEQVKSFIRDQQICDISWGDTIHVQGLISEIDPGRESEGEIEWKMKILVDQDNLELQSIVPPKPFNPSFLIDQARFKLTSISAIPSTPHLGIQVNVLDQLDDMIALVTAPMRLLSNISNQISDFEGGLAKEGKRLISGVHQAKTAILNLIDTLESAQQDTFFIRDSAADTINYNNTAKAAITEANIALALLSDLENQTTAAMRGEAHISVRVHDGDTWESISSRVYGGPSEADKLRQANGAKFSERPKPGSMIIVPGL